MLSRYFASAQFSGPTAFLFVVALLLAPLLPCSAEAAPPANKHAEMMAAYADLNAAVAEIVQANQALSTNRQVYYRAGQRAINALEGTQGAHYSAAAGNPGDAVGAIGHVESLLHSAAGTPVWEAGLDSAEANMQSAVDYLLGTIHAHSLNRFLRASSRALGYLDVARGRSTQLGGLGGMEGVLANTVLGVPAGATTVDGCKTPSSAPSYGVHGGYIAWIAIPTTNVGTYRLATSPGSASVIVHNGLIEFPSAAAALVAKACASQHAKNGTSAGSVRQASASQDPSAAAASAHQKSVPALYTKAQADAGKAIFATTCVTCHGSNMQGSVGPAVAGNTFLTTAHQNHWTVEILRLLVTTTMPFNNAGSLSKAQYADVLSFLLASNCYPAGNVAFPETTSTAEAKVTLGVVSGTHAQKNKYGVCEVR